MATATPQQGSTPAQSTPGAPQPAGQQQQQAQVPAPAPQAGGTTRFTDWAAI